MDIASLSSAISQQKIQAEAGLQVLESTKDVMEQQGKQLVDMMEETNHSIQHPNLGRRVDFSV